MATASRPGMKEGAAATAAFRKIRDQEKVGGNSCLDHRSEQRPGGGNIRQVHYFPMTSLKVAPNAARTALTRNSAGKKSLQTSTRQLLSSGLRLSARRKKQPRLTQCDGNNRPAARPGVRPHQPTSDRGGVRKVKSAAGGEGVENKGGDCWEPRRAASITSCYLFCSKC